MDTPVKEVIVLAGGLGTRLKDTIGELPKPMAPVNGLPFLHYLLHYLAEQGIHRVILSVGYQWEIIRNHFGDRFNNLELIYTIEKEPLGTGGGIRLALEQARDEHLFIINGDTYFKVELQELAHTHLSQDSDCTIALKKMYKVDRYGAVEMAGHRIIAFHEKEFREKTIINGGIYCVKKEFLNDFDPGNRFSFEKDYLEKDTTSKKITGQVFDRYFMDIGIPEDYRQFEKDIQG